MVQLQAICKMLATGGLRFLNYDLFDRDYFAPYQEQFDFIKNHYDSYGTIPDEATFVEKFPSFELIEVHESWEYLSEKLKEEKLYRNMAPILQESANRLRTDSNDAVAYLSQELDKLQRLQPTSSKPVDIIHDAKSRFTEYQQKLNGNKRDFFMPTGFSQIDEIIRGWHRKEEFIVLFARTNQGKSWVLVKTLSTAAMEGYNVGFISPEMSANSIGYRFDTLTSGFDNTDLYFGNHVDGYESYIQMLEDVPASFLVADKNASDFMGEITVSRLRKFVQNNAIQILGIDGITYLTDERAKRNDSLQVQLTHIAEDLMQMSKDLNIPIIAVVQANRDGVKVNGGNLELENIKDADGIAHNASKVIAIRQKVDEEILELTFKKNRNGKNGMKFTYQWIPNIGEFNYIPTEDDGANEETREKAVNDLKEEYAPKDGTCPF